MSKGSGVSRAAFLALLTFASSSAARGGTEGRTRVTIRGTGSNVAIERTQAPARRRSSENGALPAGVLGDAARLKAKGADDATVLAYLRAHEADLPSVIDADDVRQLRKAGAGKSVVSYLATVAAVDIGETGEGREAVASNAPPPASDIDAPYGGPYGYPLVGGYAAPYPGRFGTRGFFPPRRIVFRGGPPISRRVFPPRFVAPRRPVPR